MIGYSIIGDSISTFRGTIPLENRWFYDADDINGTGVCDACETWWGRVISQNSGKLVSNASYSGAMVQGWGFPAGSSMARAKQLIGKNGETPDVVIVYMGINDYGWGSPEAQAAGGSVASPANYDSMDRPLEKPDDLDCEGAPEGASPCMPHERFEEMDSSGMAPKDAIEHFMHAYESMLGNIKEVAPCAQIQCMTLSPGRILGKPGHFCYALRGPDLDEYNNAIRQACKNKGAFCADVRSFGLDYSSIDGTHPDLVGMRQLASLYQASIGRLEALEEFEEGMKSVRLDNENQLERDRKALIDESRWSCYMLD